jgi:hypothetical protein
MEVLHGECTGDEDGVSFSSQFFSSHFYSDKYLTILHTNYILHMPKNTFAFWKSVLYFCPVLTKSNHYTNSTPGWINRWTDIKDMKTEFLKMLFQFCVRTRSIKAWSVRCKDLVVENRLGGSSSFVRVHDNSCLWGR